MEGIPFKQEAKGKSEEDPSNIHIGSDMVGHISANTEVFMLFFFGGVGVVILRRLPPAKTLAWLHLVDTDCFALLDEQMQRVNQDVTPQHLPSMLQEILFQGQWRLKFTRVKVVVKIICFINLDLRHLSDDILNNKLPGVVELVQKFCNLALHSELLSDCVALRWLEVGLRRT